MLQRTILTALAMAVLLPVGLSAADITGAWKSEFETAQGKATIEYSFQQDGEKLTGTMQTSRTPLLSISNGKVEGEKVSFSVKVNADGFTLAHSGTISGDEIQFALAPHGEFPGMKIVAKRVKP